MIGEPGEPDKIHPNTGGENRVFAGLELVLPGLPAVELSSPEPLQANGPSPWDGSTQNTGHPEPPTVANEEATEQPEAEAQRTFPIYDNVYVLERAARDPDVIPGLADASIGTVNPLDAGADPMYDLALDFLKKHVRRVASRHGITVDGDPLLTGTAVVLHSAHHGIRWIVTGGRVLDAQGHHLSPVRLRRAQIPSRRYIWQGGRGDAVDLAYLLANVCALLDIHLPRPLAVVGTVHQESGEVPGGMWMMEQRRQAVADAGIPDLILPARCGFMPGDHLGVRYWPVFDVTQAIDALFAVASCGSQTR